MSDLSDGEIPDIIISQGNLIENAYIKEETLECIYNKIPKVKLNENNWDAQKYLENVDNKNAKIKYKENNYKEHENLEEINIVKPIVKYNEKILNQPLNPNYLNADNFKVNCLENNYNLEGPNNLNSEVNHIETNLNELKNQEDVNALNLAGKYDDLIIRNVPNKNYLSKLNCGLFKQEESLGAKRKQDELVEQDPESEIQNAKKAHGVAAKIEDKLWNLVAGKGGIDKNKCKVHGANVGEENPATDAASVKGTLLCSKRCYEDLVKDPVDSELPSNVQEDSVPVNVALRLLGVLHFFFTFPRKEALKSGKGKIQIVTFFLVLVVACFYNAISLWNCLASILAHTDEEHWLLYLKTAFVATTLIFHVSAGIILALWYPDTLKVIREVLGQSLSDTEKLVVVAGISIILSILLAALNTVVFVWALWDVRIFYSDSDGTRVLSETFATNAANVSDLIYLPPVDMNNVYFILPRFISHLHEYLLKDASVVVVMVMYQLSSRVSKEEEEPSTDFNIKRLKFRGAQCFAAFIQRRLHYGYFYILHASNVLFAVYLLCDQIYGERNFFLLILDWVLVGKIVMFYVLALQISFTNERYEEQIHARYSAPFTLPSNPTPDQIMRTILLAEAKENVVQIGGVRMKCLWKILGFLGKCLSCLNCL